MYQGTSVSNAVAKIMAEKRDTKRVKAIFSASIYANEAFVCHCVIQDVSNTGMKLKLSDKADIPTSFQVKTPSMPEMISVEMAWSKGDTLGVRFVPDAKLSG